MADKTKVSAAQLKTMAQAVGLDWTRIDWSKIPQLIALLIALFTGGVAAAAESSVGGKVDRENLKARLLAAGVPEDCCEDACKCCEAGFLALQAANLSFECCQSMCEPNV